MKTLIRFTGILLLAAGILTFGGCKEEEEKEEIDPALVGSWSNGLAEGQLKTFDIELNGSFLATLTVSAGENGNGPGTVTGVLVKEGSDYMMNNMRETTGASWGSAVGLYNRVYVQITLSNGNNTFKLECANVPIVEQFFGGTYHRQ